MQDDASAYSRTRSCRPGLMPAGTLTRRIVPSRKRTGNCRLVGSEAGMVSVIVTADRASLHSATAATRARCAVSGDCCDGKREAELLTFATGV